MWTDALRATAEIVVALSAIIGFVLLVARLRPVKWFVRKVVTDPLKSWFRQSVREELEQVVELTATPMVEEVVERAIAPIRAELTFNGGSSIKDQVTRLVMQLDNDQSKEQVA